MRSLVFSEMMLTMILCCWGIYHLTKRKEDAGLAAQFFYAAAGVLVFMVFTLMGWLAWLAKAYP